MNAILPALPVGDKWINFATAYESLGIVTTIDFDGLALFCSIPDDFKFETDEIAYVNKRGFDRMALYAIRQRPISDMFGAIGHSFKIGHVRRELSEQQNPGYIYLVKLQDTYKIGRTKDVQSRLEALKSGSPFKLTLVHSFFSADCKQLERELHKRYAHLCVKGEWFRLTTSEIDEIKAMKDE